MNIKDVIKKLKKHLTKEQKEELRQALSKAHLSIKLSEDPEEIIELSQEKWNYTIHRVWYKGQTVIRDAPFEDYYLRKKKDSEYHYYLISGDYTSDTFGLIPLDDEGDLLDTKWYNYQGDVPPESDYNPNKRIPAHDEIVDRGTMLIDTDTKRVTFKGQVLKGEYRYEGKWKDGPVLYKLASSEDLANITEDNPILTLSLYPFKPTIRVDD